jgi:hypothetical protein
MDSTISPAALLAIAQAAQSYPTLLSWWMAENVKHRHMWPGHNASRAAGTVWAPDELLEQIRLTRARTPAATSTSACVR